MQIVPITYYKLTLQVIVTCLTQAHLSRTIQHSNIILYSYTLKPIKLSAPKLALIAAKPQMYYKQNNWNVALAKLLYTTTQATDWLLIVCGSAYSWGRTLQLRPKMQGYDRSVWCVLTHECKHNG